MRREDWLWLAIKVAGVWLLLEGVRALPGLATVWMLHHGDEDTSPAKPFLDAVIPIAIGAATLAMQLGRLAPTSPAAEVPSELPGSNLRREDWLWVGMKLVGLWFLLQWIPALI